MLRPLFNASATLSSHCDSTNIIIIIIIIIIVVIGNGDAEALHAALPVIKGEKYLANVWVWDPARPV